MTAEEPITSAEQPKKAALLLPALAVAASLGAAGGVYFLAPASLFGAASPGEATPESTHADQKPGVEGKSDAHKAAKPEVGHGAADAKKHGKGDHGSPKDGGDETDAKFSVVGAVGVFTPEPLVVTIRPSGRVRYLKLGYAVETDPESETTFLESELRIRDALNIYLRSVDIDALEDPSVMSRLRSQIARRIQLIVGTAPVHAVLITDFILS